MFEQINQLEPILVTVGSFFFFCLFSFKLKGDILVNSPSWKAHTRSDFVLSCFGFFFSFKNRKLQRGAAYFHAVSPPRRTLQVWAGYLCVSTLSCESEAQPSGTLRFRGRWSLWEGSDDTTPDPVSTPQVLGNASVVRGFYVLLTEFSSIYLSWW